MALALNNKIFGGLEPTTWTTHDDRPLNAENLEALFDNRIPAIRVSGFVSQHECQQISEFVRAIGHFQSYTFRSTASNIHKIGPAQCEYSYTRRNEYFSEGDRAKVLQKKLAEMAFNPLDRVLDTLRGGSNRSVSLATEPSFGEYFAGVFRQINQGALLHVDFAPLDAPHWAIGEIDYQISWNLYLRAPTEGGECIVHDRPWELEDEAYKVPDSYHYDRTLVEGRVSKSHEFVEGDLVFFNSRNFHEVEASADERLTMSSFVGRLPTGNLVLWS